MVDKSNRWGEGRPSYYSLPGENQRYWKDPEFTDLEADPPIADWLTAWVDEELIAARDKAESFYENYLNPDSALPEALDWLAQFAGYTGNYWDSSWPVAVKRTLIKEAYSVVWPQKGSRELLEWLFGLFNLNATIYSIGELLADITPIPATVGGIQLEYYVLIGSNPIAYLRDSSEWKLIERLNDLFRPVYTDTVVAYDYLIADFSVVGDPVF